MGDFFLDDLFPEHPKAVAAGDNACWLYVCGLAWAHRHNTGRIPKTQVPRLTTYKNHAPLARRLVDVGLWHDRGDHFEIHDWEVRNARAIAKRSQAREAAERRWRPKPPSENDATAYASASNPHMRNGCETPCDPDNTEQCVSNAEAMPYQPRNQGTKQQQGFTTVNPPREAAVAAAADKPEQPKNGPDLLEHALNALAERRFNNSRRPVDNPAGFIRAAIVGLRKDHAERIATIPAGLTTVDEIIDWIEPKPARKPSEPQDDTTAAARRNMALNELRNTHPCPDCDAGWRTTDNGLIRCSTCNGTGTTPDLAKRS